MAGKKTNKNTNIEQDLEDKIEELVEKKVEEAVKKRFVKKSSSSGIIKVVGELVGYIIFLLLAFRVFPKLGFVTVDYMLWLPIGFRMTTISTLLKIGKHTSSINPIRRVLEIGSMFASLYSTYVLVRVYPFNFTRVGWSQIDTVFPFALKMAIFAMLLGILVNFIRIFIPDRKD